MAFHRNSKADTVFLSDTASSTLAADLSQYGASLTDNITYLTSTSTRFGIRSPRSIAVVVGIDNNDSGIIIQHGAVSGVNPNYKITANGAGSVVFVQAATTLATIALPSVGASSANYLLHWASDYDEVDNVWYSEIAVCRVASALWTIVRVTHAQPPAPAVGDQFNVSGYGAGVTLFNGGIARYTSVRIGTRFVTSTEASEDFVVQSSAPSITGHDPLVELAPYNSVDVYEDDGPGVVSDAILDTATFAGPAEWLAVLHAGEARQRLYSSLLNVELVTPPVLQSTYLPANFHFAEPDVATYGPLRYGVQYLFFRAVPVTPSGPIYARVRVHVQTYLAAGSPVGSLPELQLRMLSSATLWSSPSCASSSYTALATCTTNHGSAGTGEWITLGEMQIRTGGSSPNLTFLVLGYSLGEAADTGLTFRRAKIKAIEMDLYTKD